MPLRIVKFGLTTNVSEIYISQIKQYLLNKTGRELIVMVPDRFSYLAEKRICESVGGLGFGGVQVLTLHQLIRQISKSTDSLSAVGKQMLLRGIIDDKIGEDSVFYGAKDRNGFIQSILEVMNDWKRFCVDVHKLEKEVDNKGDSLTSRKLMDLIGIYNEYNRIFDAKGFKDETDLLIEASEIIQKDLKFQNAVIWIDGFVEFAPAEMNIIKAFLAVGGDVRIFLPSVIDIEPEDGDVYSVPYGTEANLCAMCKKHGFEYTLEQVDAVKKSDDAIAYLCDTYDSPDAIYQKQTESIVLHKADDIFSEVEHAAAKITDLVCEEGYKFSDISLLCGDLNNYASCIEAVFERYSIPYFSDYKVPLSNHPISILLMCVFDILDKKSFSQSHVIRYLKTGYIIEDSDDVDFLALFIKKRGIRGSMWADEKYFTTDSGGFFDEAMGKQSRTIPEHKKLLELRSVFADPLFEYYEMSKGSMTVRQHVCALFELFKKIRLFDKIQSNVVGFEDSGDENEAARLTHVWNILINIFDQMVLALEGKKLNRATFGQYLRAGIEGSEISIIPSVINGVTVSDAGHRKGAEVKALIILGATHSTVPAVNTEDNLISEDELELFEGLPHSVGKSFRNLSKEFELLTAFSETSHYLYISNSSSGVGGEPEEDSKVFDIIKNKFPGTKITKIDDDLFLSVPETMLHKLLVKIASGQELTPYYHSIMQWFHDNEGWEDAFGLLEEAEKYKILTGNISKEMSRSLYENLTQYSVSRLEKYFQCPFMYFLNYGLKLDDGEDFGMKSTDTGSLVHHALAQFCSVVEEGAATSEEKRMRWESITDKRCNEIIDGIISGLIENSDIILEQDPKMQSIFSRLQSTIKKAANMIVLMLVNGRYSIYGNEMPFEDFKLQGENGEITFHGIIDRLDVYEDDGKINIRIVDYKTGEKSFNLVDALNGVDLQLIIYAMAAKNIAGDRGDIAGMFYNSVKNRMASLKDQSELEPELRKLYLLSGTVVEQEQDSVLSVKTGYDMDCDLQSLGESSFLPLKLKKDGAYTASSSVASKDVFSRVCANIKQITTNAAWDIENGNVKVYPYKTKKKDACRFCPFSCVCMYDICSGAQVNGGEKGKEIMEEIKNNGVG